MISSWGIIKLYKSMFSKKLIILCTIIAFTSCKNKDKQIKKKNPSAYPVIEIPTKTVTTYKDYPVHIEGIINSEIRAKVEGYIEKVLVDEGQYVHKNQPLFKLETQSLSQDANAAKAIINVSKVEVDKLIPLVEKGIVSQVQLETAKANLQRAKSTYQSILEKINYAAIKSPVEGFVGTINFREGSLVGRQNSMPLTTVMNVNQIYAYFAMSEKDYLNFLEQTKGKDIQEKIKNLPECSLILANDKEYEKKGKIQTVIEEIDPDTGTMSFRAIFDNPNHLITNNNSGVIKIPFTYKDVIVIPQKVTYDQQGKTYVYKVSPENHVKAIPVKVEAESDNLYIITKGIKKGEKIVAAGIQKLRDKMRIIPQEMTFDSIAKPVKKVFR